MCTYTLVLAVGSAPFNTLVLWSSYHRDIKLFGALFFLFPNPPLFSTFVLSCADYQSFFFLIIPQRYRLATPINILRTNFHALNNDRFRILIKAINNCDDTIKIRFPFLPLRQFGLPLFLFYIFICKLYLLSIYKYIIICIIESVWLWEQNSKIFQRPARPISPKLINLDFNVNYGVSIFL